MLLRFSVENHRSIKLVQELSLVAVPQKRGSEVLITTRALQKERILPAAIIYGPNASGKSNLIHALGFMKSAVLRSQNNWEADSGVPYRPFLLSDETSIQPSRYEIDFISGGIRYIYGFANNADEFVGEWLFSFPEGRQRLLYERYENQEFKFGSGLTGKKSIVKDIVRRNSLFLSAAIQSNMKSLIPVFDFFKNILIRNSINSPPQVIYSEFKGSKLDERVMNFLDSIGTGIDGYRELENDRPEESIEYITGIYNAIFDKEKNKDKMMKDLLEDMAKEFKIEFSHKSSDGKSVFFDVAQESTGTRRLIPLLIAAFKAIDNGSILVIDEFDASLHTQICDLIVALFNNKNINKFGAQLIATTHDTNLLCSNNLRRDQIWLVEKNSYGASELYSLAEMKTRDTDNFEKGYLQGRYGAMPFSGSMDQILVKL